uniref:Integrase core domain containing protein n=1 Tax=Solanum tuberosum TaxID=4113 RepID=M1DJR3_SOLTU
MHDTWWRFSQKLKKCPNHDLTERHLKQAFYRSLNYVTKPVVDAVCGGSFMRKSYSKSMQLLDEVSKNNKAWYTKDAEQNRYDDQDIDLIEEANYLGNQGGFRNYNSGNQGYNSENAGRNYARDAVEATLSLLNQRKNGSLPSDTIQNPKKDGYCMAIATRSGKVLTDPISAEVVADEDMRVPIEERMVVETLAAMLMNFDADFWSDYIETVNALQVRGKSIDISEASINRMFYGPEYSALASVGLFEGKHHQFIVVGTLDVVPPVPIDIPHADRGLEQGESSQPSTEAPPPPASASQAQCTFVTIPMLFLEKLVADQRQTRTLVDQIVLRMPQLIEMKVLATKKEIKDEVRKVLVVLKDRLDGLENPVQHRFQVVGYPPLNQLMIFGENPPRVSPARENTKLENLMRRPLLTQLERQEKRVCRTSKREAREKEALEQQQRDTALVGASSSGALAPTSEDQTDHIPSSESAPIDKGANADPTTGA